MGPRNLALKTREKVCVWCVFDIVIVLDQTLCLQLMAAHSVWRHLVTQKPDKKQNLRADFKIAEGYSIGHG